METVEHPGLPPMNWRLSLDLENSALQHGNPLPLLVQCAAELQGLQHQRKSIYTILSELFSNALEHGLLDLDSGLKTDQDGFEKYYQLRRARLDTLNLAKMNLTLAHHFDRDGRTLSVSVSHNGTGFEPHTLQHVTDDLHTGLCGRGIPIINRLCDSLTYTNGGRSATAVLSLNESEA